MGQKYTIENGGGLSHMFTGEKVTRGTYTHNYHR